jgi:hypothetical protein
MEYPRCRCSHAEFLLHASQSAPHSTCSNFWWSLLSRL